MNRSFRAVALWTLVAVFCSKAASDGSSPVQLSAWGWMSFGQVMNSTYLGVNENSDYGLKYNNLDFTGAWLTDVDAGVRLFRSVTERTDICIHGGLGLRISAPRKATGADKTLPYLKYVFPYLIETSINSRLVDRGIVKLGLKGGYFSTRYNPEVRNLGEYLFRTQAYPTLLATSNAGFEMADKHKMLGIKASLTLFDWFRQDLFVASETESYPPYDLTVSYIAGVKPVGIVDFAAGISFSHLIAMEERRTTPGVSKEDWNGSSTYRSYLRAVDDNGDTVNFTFRNTKAMVRVTLDPLYFFRPAGMGKEDLKLYAEAAILGLKNYPMVYEYREHRMPIMFGVNVPTFGLLDVLAAEVEWFDGQYSQGTTWMNDSRLPIPEITIDPFGENGPTVDNKYPWRRVDNWKWVIYARKSIGDYLRISAQVGRDHTLRTRYMTSILKSSAFDTFEEIFQRPEDWYWMARVAVML